MAAALPDPRPLDHLLSLAEVREIPDAKAAILSGETLLLFVISELNPHQTLEAALRSRTGELNNPRAVAQALRIAGQLRVRPASLSSNDIAAARRWIEFAIQRLAVCLRPELRRKALTG